MKSKSKTRWGLIILVLLALLFLALILMVGYQYMAMRVMANTPTPLVLIHNPHNQETLYDGEFTPIHATARSESGISRMELWVNGEFVKGLDSPNGEPVSPLVLNELWAPESVGNYEIIIKAIDGNDIEGVGSILINSERTDPAAAGEVDPLTDAAAEGDQIADDGAGEPDSASDEGSDAVDSSSPGGGGDAGPDGGGGPAPGSGDGPGEPEGRSDDPPPSSIPLGEMTIVDVFWGLLSLGDDDNEEVPTDEEGFVLLTIEALELETNAAYDEVHCYVGLGGNTPLWYPDADLDQSTDESFAYLGSHFWNIQEYMGGDKAIRTGWPAAEPFLLTINCIATTAGGTVAVDLGIVAINAPSEEWDGLTRVAVGEGEGQFWFGYRISMEQLVEKELDPEIPIPFNVHVDERRQELVWEWEDTPERDGRYVNGFLVYVNETLVFSADKRGESPYSVRIPDSWFIPPCRTEYEFTVAAHEYGYPDADYSYPSEPLVLPDPDEPMPSDCQPEFRIDFHTLRIGDVPLDGSIIGSIYADDTGRTFHGFPLDSNSSYDVRSMVWESSGERSHFNLEPSPGDVIMVGFDLAKYGGMALFETICESYYDEYDYFELMEYGYFERTLYSVRTDDRGRSLCQMDYTINHVGGTPLGLGSDSLPLPWLDITNMSIEPGTNNVILEITNNGNAMWTEHDLKLGFDYQFSELVLAGHDYAINFVLDVGETKVFRSSKTAANLYEYCIRIDPDGEVLELYEQSGALDHATYQYCIPKPDLRLQDVQYDFNTNTLKMQIWNAGSLSNTMGTSDVNTADLTVEIDVPGQINDFVSEDGEFAGQVIERDNGIWIDWMLTAQQRELMNDGYTVILDPDNQILETNEDNNSFTVPGGENLRLVWNGIYMRWYPDQIIHLCPHYGRWAGHDYEVWLDISTQSEYSNHHIQSWHYEGGIGGDVEILVPGYGWRADTHVVDFYIHGEEHIEIDVRGEQEGESLGSAAGIYPAEFDWYSLRTVSETQACRPSGDFYYGHPISVYPHYRNWGFNCGGWAVYVNTCIIHTP